MSDGARRALVTGASAGIGRACAEELHAAGWAVTGASRRGTSSGGWTGLVMDVDDDDSVRVGVDTWVVGAPGALTVDNKTLSPPYSILAIGDPPTLAAAMNIPGGAEDSVKRVGARMTVQQAERVDVTTLRQPKPHQYAQPVK